MDYYLNPDTQMYKDVNLVYEDNNTLSEFANMINQLSDHKVDIKILEEGFGKSYCGNGKVLSYLGLDLMGLEKSLEHYYEACIC